MSQNLGVLKRFRVNLINDRGVVVAKSRIVHLNNTRDTSHTISPKDFLDHSLTGQAHTDSQGFVSVNKTLASIRHDAYDACTWINGDFAKKNFTYDTMSQVSVLGWTVHLSGTKMYELDIIAGKPTPELSLSRPTYNKFQLVDDAESSAGHTWQINSQVDQYANVMVLTSDSVQVAPGRMHRGPYMVSQQAINLLVNDQIRYNYKISGTDNALCEAVIYLVSERCGNTVVITESFGQGSGTWQTVSRTILANEIGNYKLVVVNGCATATKGANLYITGISVLKALPCQS